MRSYKVLSTLLLVLASICFHQTVLASDISESQLRNFLKNELKISNAESIDLNKTIQKGEALEWIGKNAGIIGILNPDEVLPYSDVPKNASYAPYVRELYDIGALPRVSKANTNLLPTSNIKLVHFLSIFFYVEGVPLSRVVREDLAIRDVNRQSFLAPIFQKALELGLLNVPNDKMIRPYHFVTYGEIASIMYAMRSPAAVSSDFFESSDMSFFQDVTQTVLNKYYHRRDLSDEDTRRMVYGALEGFVQELGDPYSNFLPPLENGALQERLTGEFEGIGAYIGQGSDKRMIITSALKGSPAAKAGLRSNDVILRINDLSTAAMSLTEAIAHIKGPKGTNVTLTIERTVNDQIQVLDIVVTRDKIIIETIEKAIIESNGKKIAYIKIYEFGGKTNGEFLKVANEIANEDKADGIVLDLRGNPGGFLDGSVNILGYFVAPDQNVVSIKYLSYSTDRILKNNSNILGKFPLVVMINGGSASAAEIVSGALSELNKAPLIGEKSFGKGTVQEIISYDGGASLKLTVAEYTLPSGKSINGTGIPVDVKAIDNPETEDVDEALDIAVSELKKQIK